MRDEIIDATAWILWAQAWVSWAEENDGPSPGAGGSWDPFVPAVPSEVHAAAVKLIKAIESLNGASIEVLYQRAANMPGKHYREPTAERFGTCIGYQAAGAGVSWSDDHPNPEYRIPYMEVYTCDGKTVDVSDVRRF